MNRIMTMTVIRGNGECQEIVNGVVSKELKRLQAEERIRHEAEKNALRRQYIALDEELGIVRSKRNAMLAERLEEIDYDLNPCIARPFLHGIADGLANIYAAIYGMFYFTVGRGRR